MNQHATPCGTCPFRRDCTPGELGGSPVETFIGQAYGAFWVPCHERIDYSDPNWREQYTAGQCAGAAIYRSNCHPSPRPAKLLHLPENRTLVFGSPAEFYAHHAGITVQEAQRRLYYYDPSKHWWDEMMKAEARLIPEGKL